MTIAIRLAAFLLAAFLSVGAALGGGGTILPATSNAWVFDISSTSEELDGLFAAPNRGAGVIVYVFDAGIDIDHPQFAGRILSAKNFGLNQPEWDVADRTLEQHGNKVACVLVCGDYGIIPEAKVVVYRIEGRLSFLNAVADAYLDRVARGMPPSVAVVSSGLEQAGFQDDLLDDFQQEVAFFASAGNNNTVTVPWPASQVIGVGSVGPDHSKSPNSNYGSAVRYYAYGSIIVTPWGNFSGTSAAAPVATAIAAIKLSAMPWLTPAQLRAELDKDALKDRISGLPPNSNSNNIFLFIGGTRAAAKALACPTLSLGSFEAQISWYAPNVGEGCGQPKPIDGVAGSGTFWFFNANNLEMLIKVLDACTFNQRFWVFYAATTNVEFGLVVTDTFTGEQIFYHNPLGVAAAPVQDTEAFACDG